MRKRKDLDNYIQVNEEPHQKKKQYQYQGEYFQLSTPDRLKNSYCNRNLNRSMLALMACIVMGLIDPGSLRQLYGVIPFVVLLYFSGESLWHSILCKRAPERMTLRQKEQSFDGLEHSSRLQVIFSILLFIAQVLYILIDTYQPRDALAAGLSILSCIVSMANLRERKENSCVAA